MKLVEVCRAISAWLYCKACWRFVEVGGVCFDCSKPCCRLGGLRGSCLPLHIETGQCRAPKKHHTTSGTADCVHKMLLKLYFILLSCVQLKIIYVLPFQLSIRLRYFFYLPYPYRLGVRMGMMPRAAPSAMRGWGARRRCQPLLV